MPWVLQKSDFFDSRFERFKKKHREEATAVLDNLDTYFKALENGSNPININAGFIHHEPEGIKAIDQKGGKGKLMQTRLYIYPDSAAMILYVISIGTKVDQKGDIRECQDYIRPLKRKG
ncbi:MAG: hypothetical protein ABSE00_00305 [Chitinispirillaceae bacterium]|jgi:hypothetical protein